MQKHILSAEQFTRDDIRQLSQAADGFRAQHLDYSGGRQELKRRYFGYLMISLFYEGSTRTRLSFEIAAEALGMGVTGTEQAKLFSSAAKGETLEDTIRVLNEYNPDLIVLRHNETGGAARAAAVSRVPIINGGDGKGEHPTQALLDLYTIEQTQGRLDNLNVVIGGDLAHGRTARSLAKLLARYAGNALTFVSTPQLRIGDDIREFLSSSSTDYTETQHLEHVLRDADVVYWTRLQTERLDSSEIVRDAGFVIDQSAMDTLSEHSVLLHPLPRVGEIDPAIDGDPRAQYFRQAGNGLYMRMALIDTILRSPHD